ncbi:MAG: YsnF/AvaK domain-containing protein [Ktedonobacteraceae bacterium]|nr:YsnF/AvaK domain-containing protein [Ktedonobacteraceae bacterium]
MANRKIVTGVFQDEATAQRAIAELENAGFDANQIKYSTHKGGGGITESLLGMGIAQDEAAYYNSEFEAGRTVVTVNTADRQQEAYDILARSGAYDASNRAGQATTTGAANYAAYDTNVAQTNETSLDEEGRRRLALREEVLQAEKQRVQAGEVTLHKDVVTEQRSIDVPVTHEEVYIERRPGSGQASDLPIGQDEVIRVPVTDEQVNVTKQSVVTGEVAIGKRQVQETKTYTDTVKHEEARIEREGDVHVRTNDAIDDPNR